MGLDCYDLNVLLLSNILQIKRLTKKIIFGCGLNWVLMISSSLNITGTLALRIERFYFLNRGRCSLFTRGEVGNRCVFLCVCVIAEWFHLVAKWVSFLWLTTCSPCAWRWLGTAPGPGNKHTDTHKHKHTHILMAVRREMHRENYVWLHIVTAALYYYFALSVSHTHTHTHTHTGSEGIPLTASFLFWPVVL